MATTAGAPKVTLTEADLSGGAVANSGAYVAMVIPAPRGPVGVPVLVTDEPSLIANFALDGGLVPASDSSFWVAIETLKKTNKLWVARANEQGTMGGAFVRVAGAVTAGAANAGAPAEFGFPNVNHYDITSTDGRINPGAVVFTADTTPGYLSITHSAYQSLVTGDVVQLAVSNGGTLPAPLVAATNYYAIVSPVTDKIQLASSSQNAAAGTALTLSTVGSGTFTLTCTAKSLSAVAWTPDFGSDSITVTSSNYDLLLTGDKLQAVAVGSATLPTPLQPSTDYYVIKTPVTNKLKLATTLLNAQNGVAIDLTTVGSGTLELVFASITATTAGQDKALLFYGADPGSYNNNVSITLTNYASNPVKVKEPGAFLVEVFYNGVPVPSEKFLCSFDPTHKGANGQGLFVVDVLNSSAFVRAQVNPLLAPTATTVADALTPIAFSGGSDGLAVTDATMIRTVNLFAQSQRYPVTFLTDSGWTTPAYQLACIQVVEQLGAACAFISTPYEAEVTTNALLDVVAYYQGLGSQSTHAGIFTSHVKVADQYNNRQIWISPVGAVAGEYAYAFDQLGPGQPIGGRYGQLTVLDVARRWTDGELDYLYDNNVNPIRFKPGKGVEIWGQKTLQSRPSDLDRLNARLLLMVIEPGLRDAYEEYLFTRNSVSDTEGVRRDITVLTDNFMQGIKSRGGVYAWRTICNASNNSLVDVQNEQVNVWLLVQIVKSVEYVAFTIGITPTSVDLSIASSLLTSQ